MAAMGYYSGLLEGTKTLKELALEDRDTSTKEANVGINRQRLNMDMANSQSENSFRDTQRMALMQKMQQEDDQDKIMNNVFNANLPGQLAAGKQDLDSNLAQNSITAGTAMMGTNPELGMKLVTQGQDIKKQADQSALEGMQIQQKKVELQGDVFSRITDQSSLDQAQQDLSKLGVTIPDQYKTWNDSTKAWVSNRSIASDNWVKNQAILQQTRANDIRDANEKRMQQDTTDKIHDRNQRETLARDKLDMSRGRVKTQPTDVITQEMSVLNDKSSDFKSLSAGEKINASQDVFALAASHLRDGDTKDQAQAMELARQDVLGLINKDTGKYGGVTATKTPTLGLFLEKAKADPKNAKYTDEQLTDYYNKTYKK